MTVVPILCLCPRHLGLLDDLGDGHLLRGTAVFPNLDCPLWLITKVSVATMLTGNFIHVAVTECDMNLLVTEAYWAGLCYLTGLGALCEPEDITDMEF
jgi:hypothetical protein